MKKLRTPHSALRTQTAVGIIPARYGSERFPGKVLYRVRGKTILQHAYESARKAKSLAGVYIATDSPEIARVAGEFGAPVLMTSDTCRSGTDRVAEAARALDAAIIVDIQADEPFIPVEAIEAPLAQMRRDRKILVATAATRIRKKEELYDSNITKVVFDRNGDALYFSGSLVPLPRIYFSDRNLAGNRTVVFYKHIGVYHFRREFLPVYVGLETSFLERIEKLEQLRILENGYRIRVAVVTKDSPCIDTLTDLERLA